MLLTIHNLPSTFRYTDVKNMLNEKCGLTEIILDNLVAEGKGKKVTVGLANDDDGALVTRKINGLVLHGNQLYIEDRRRKTSERDQPYRVSTNIPESRSAEPNLGNSAMGGIPMAGNVPMMWNYNVATPYMVQVPVEQSFAYGGYGGAPQTAYMEPQPVVPVEPERGYSGFQGDSYPPGNAPRDQEPGAWGRSGRDQVSDNYRHPDRKRHLSPVRPVVPKKRASGTRWNEKEAPKRREPSPPRQQWSQDMNQDPRPPFRQPEPYTRDQNQYQPREPKPNYRAAEPQWENRWDAPKPRERERDWGNGNNPNWEPQTDKVWEKQPNQNWRDEPIHHEPMQNNEPVDMDWEGEYSHISERDGPEWFDRQPEKQMDQYRGDKFYERSPIEHEARSRQRDTDWIDRRPQNDRDGLRRPQNDRDAPRRPPSDREIPRRPQNDRDAPRRPPNDRDVPRRPPIDRDDSRRPHNDRDAPRRPHDDRDAPRHPRDDRDAPRRPPNDRDVPRRPLNDRDPPRRPHIDMDRELGGPGASRSLSSSNRISRRDQLPRREISRSDNVPQERDYREDRRNPPKDIPGGTREKPDYWRQIADDYPAPKKTDYRREDFNKPRHEQGVVPDMPKKPAMREERHPYPSKDDHRFPPQKSQTLTTLINKDSCNRGQATAMIAKLMLGIRGKVQFTSGLNAFIFKQLKLCIKSRIDVLLGEELSSDMDEVIKRYRVKFPSSGDKVLLQQIREKSTKEFEVLQEQRKIAYSEANAVKKEKEEQQDTSTSNDSKNAATTAEAKPEFNEAKPEVKPTDATTDTAGVAATPNVVDNPAVGMPAPKVIPPPPQLPKHSKNKPLTDKQVIRHMKLQRKWEYDNDDLYSLDTVTKKALDDEIEALDKYFAEECANPANPHEELICKRILSDSLNEFDRTVSLYITKRFLNIQTGLAIRMYAQGKLPRKEAVKQMLKKYRIEALKKSVKGNMYVINLSRFHDFDALCKMEQAVIDGIPVTFKAMNLVGPPLKISRNQVLKMRQQQIHGQIEDFNMDDFEETNDYTEDVGENTEDANADWPEDVNNENFTDVTEDFTENDTENADNMKSEDFTENVQNENLTENGKNEDFTEDVDGTNTENDKNDDFTEDVDGTNTEEANNLDFTEDVNVGNFATDNITDDNDTENAVIDNVNIDDIDDDDLEDF